MVLTQYLLASAQCFAAASGDMRAGMYERGCASRDGFDAVFAGFCAVFRRGEQGCTSGDVLPGTVLTQCLQGSAHQLRSNRF